MKKFCLVVTVMTLLLGPAVVMKQVALAEETTNSSYEALSQEAERNRELLEIWKDHVKTLTKERDAAYKELEQAKAAGVPMSNPRPMAQFGGVESQPMPSMDASAKIQDLQSEVTQLRAQLEERTQMPAETGSNRELQMQFSALQSRLQQLNKELAQTKSEKDRLIQEKEKALSQVERLSAQQEQAAPAAPSREDEEAVRRARSLSYENETLKAKIEKLQVVEKELESTRSYFAPLLENLQRKNQQLSDENASMKSELIQIRAETDGASGQAEQYFEQLQKANAQIQAMKSDQEEAANQVASFKSQYQAALADRDRYADAQEEYQRLAATHKSMEQAYTELENSYRTHQAKFRDATAQLANLKRENEGLRAQMGGYQQGSQEIKAREERLTKQNEVYRTTLRANLTDMKNLKSNFEAYLDSLVASFDERAKQ